MRVLITMMLLATTAIAAPQRAFVDMWRSAQSPSFPTGAVIWYAMSDSTDSSGNGNDVSFVSNVTFSGVAFFTGTNNYLRRDAFAEINLYTQFTISVWARNNVWIDNFPRLVERGGNTEFGWVWNNVTGRRLGVYRAGTLVTGSDVINRTTNVWNHYVLIYDKSTTNTYKEYLDTTNVFTSGDLTAIPARTNNIFIGGNTPLQTTADYHGYMDNFRYYTRALTTDEILQLYNEGHDEIP